MVGIVCLSSLSIGYAAENRAQVTTSPTAGGAVLEKTTKSKNSPAAFSNPATAIFVKHNAPQFKLRLESNPSTGYSWFLTKYDVNLIKVVRHKFYPSQSPIPGAPGYEEWAFKATPLALAVPHITHIVMVYARPSETDHSHEHKKFTIVSK